MFETGYINGLRALAAITVLVTHCMIWSGWPGLGLPNSIPVPGEFAKMAVDLFMILSGYLMVLHAHTRSAVDPMSKPRSWLIFYVRRLLRIAPTYYLAIIVALVLAEQISTGGGFLAHRVPWLDRLINGGGEAKAAGAVLEAAVSETPQWYSIYLSQGNTNIFMHVTFLFGLIPAWVNALPLPDWSLSLEMQFYFVFPALMVFSNRFGMIRVCLFLVPLCMFSTATWRATFPEPSLLFFKLPVFCSGMLLCQATIVSDKAHRLALKAVSIALMATQYQYYGGRVWFILAAPLFMALLTHETENITFSNWQRRFKSLLDNNLTKNGSDLAYPIYLFHSFWVMILGSALFHIPAFEALNPHVRTALFTVAIFTGTIYASLFVRHLIEVPGINVGRLVISRLRQTGKKQTVDVSEIKGT